MAVNLDIGGGTTNIVAFDCGETVSTGCLDVGGRLIRLGEDLTVRSISPAAAPVAAARAAGLRAGGAVMLERGNLPLMPWCLGVWLLAAQKKRKKHLQSSRRYDKLPWTQ